jgi:hypothetical protein
MNDWEFKVYEVYKLKLITNREFLNDLLVFFSKGFLSLKAQLAHLFQIFPMSSSQKPNETA